MKFKEFLLSMVSPLKMKKYRFMSVFIAMLIFVMSVYCVALPHQVYIKNHREKFLGASSYTRLYMDMPEISLGEEFLKDRYRTEKGEVEINGEKEEAIILKSDRTDNKVKTYFYEYDIKDEEDNTRHIKFYIGVDINNTIFDAVGNYQKEYTKKYEKDSDNKKAACGYIIYVNQIRTTEEINDAWKNAQYDRIHNLTEEALQEEMSNLTDLDLFNIKGYDKDTYMISMFNTYINSHVPHVQKVKKDKNTTVDRLTFPALQVAYNTFNINFDFTKAENLDDFGKVIQDVMFTPLYNQEKAGYLLQVVGYVILFPAVYALILFWCLKKRGVMKTYKEYYNIASIASIIPLIITFIVSWFVPNVIILYGALFCMAALFVYIKINTTPELGD